MPSAELSITILFVFVSKAILAIHSLAAEGFHHLLLRKLENHQEIHAYLHLAVPTLMEELLATDVNALVVKTSSEHRHTVVLNVSQTQNVLQDWLVLETNVKTLVREAVHQRHSVPW